MALPAPIKHCIERLAAESGFPVEAVDECLRRRDESVPLLAALLQRAARGTALDEAEASQLFLGLHILAQLRYAPAYAPLLRLLRLRSETIEDLLGDAVVETLPRIVASLYDEDADALFDMIADAAVDGSVREALWRAATGLTRQSRIATTTMKDFIVRYDDERLAPHDDMAWVGWVGAIAALGLSDLAPRVKPLWTDDRLPDKMLDRQHFADDLAAGVRGEAREGAEPIDDVAEALTWVDWDGPHEPYINPMRYVGRNDPCPCGSGRKAKKCCLAAA